MPSACAPDCNTLHKQKEFAAGAVHRRSASGPGTPVARCQANVLRSHFAKANQARSVGRECPWPSLGAWRHGRTHRHCRAPGRPAPEPRGRPQWSVGPATRPPDVESPRTTPAVAGRGPEPETQTSDQRSAWGTTHRSMAAIACAWFRRNVFQVCEGGAPPRIVYLDTVDWATSNPSLRSSPWIRDAPNFSFPCSFVGWDHAWHDRSLAAPAGFRDFQRQNALRRTPPRLRLRGSGPAANHEAQKHNQNSQMPENSGELLIRLPRPWRWPAEAASMQGLGQNARFEEYSRKPTSQSGLHHPTC